LTISEEDQTLYHSGVGMLLYLVKHSPPDIANSVCELSKSMSGATEAAFKELKRVIKFVLDTRRCGLKLQPKAVTEDEHWSMTVFTDSDWAGDKQQDQYHGMHCVSIGCTDPMEVEGSEVSEPLIN
jgi:hypothetical protein